MSNQLFIALCVPFFGGLLCLKFRYRKLGSALMGISVAVFMLLLPWGAIATIDKSLPHFHRWFTPRRATFRIYWSAFSASMGAAAWAGVAWKSVGPNTEDWKTPKDSSAVDKELDRGLRGKSAPGETFVGRTKTGLLVRLTAREREGHMQVVGPTRSGKSQLLLALAAQDIKANLPLFFMEAKGDRGDFDQFLKTASLAGRVESVRYFNPQDPRSMTFNPIRPVAGQDPTAVANQIARAIGREPTSSGQGQDYYRGVDYAKIQSMAEVFCSTGRAFTLRDCYYYFAFPEAREEALKLCGDWRLTKLAREEFKANSDSSGLTSALRPWTTGALGDLLNSYAPQIRLEDVFEKRQAAYFAVPIGHLQVLANPLGRMVISGLLSVAAARQRTEPKPGPATVILDEFAEFATPVFSSFVATVGSARMRAILSHQDLGQLRRVEGMDADAFESVVFNNTSGCKVCFRAPDPEDAEFWALMLGTHTTTRDTERVEGGMLGEMQTGSRSRRMVERFKVHPNQLKTLESGTALVMAPGRAECLVRTARVREVVGKTAVPALVTVPAVPEKGLDLRSAVPNYGADPMGGKS
jgi:type IV secretory pathway TraG/TraD family ATPase VirD4